MGIFPLALGANAPNPQPNNEDLKGTIPQHSVIPSLIMNVTPGTRNALQLINQIIEDATSTESKVEKDSHNGKDFRVHSDFIR
jgi:hypothetical protein